MITELLLMRDEVRQLMKTLLLFFLPTQQPQYKYVKMKYAILKLKLSQLRTLTRLLADKKPSELQVVMLNIS